MRLTTIHHRIIKILTEKRIDSFNLWQECEDYTMNEINNAVEELAAMGNPLVDRIKWRRKK